jgi:nucleotide-binding universal stress UspA family protein
MLPSGGGPVFKNILIPTDGSEFSEKAAARAIALAKALGARVTAYFAAPPATPIVYRGNLPVGYATTEEHQRLIDETTAKTLGAVETAAKAAGVACESLHTTSDFPDEEILKVAARKGCDLIVMASHGQSGLRGVLIGSVAQKVINRSPVTVMVVR